MFKAFLNHWTVIPAIITVCLIKLLVYILVVHSWWPAFAICNSVSLFLYQFVNKRIVYGWCWQITSLMRCVNDNIIGNLYHYNHQHLHHHQSIIVTITIPISSSLSSPSLMQLSSLLSWPSSASLSVSICGWQQTKNTWRSCFSFCKETQSKQFHNKSRNLISSAK